MMERDRCHFGLVTLIFRLLKKVVLNEVASMFSEEELQIDKCKWRHAHQVSDFQTLFSLAVPRPDRE